MSLFTLTLLVSALLFKLCPNLRFFHSALFLNIHPPQSSYEVCLDDCIKLLMALSAPSPSPL